MLKTENVFDNKIKYNRRYINPVITNGIYFLDDYLVEEMIRDRSIIYVINLEKDKMMSITPFEREVDRNSHGSFIKFENATSLDISDWDKKLYTRFHWSWVEIMYGFLNDSSFKNLNKQLNNNERKLSAIIPAQSDVYNAFSIDLNLCNVVIMGQAPSKEGKGYAFSNSSSAKAFNTDDCSLTKWVNQNVLLLNASLTLNVDNKSDYYDEWKPFINYVIKIVSLKTDVIWLLVGKKSQSYKEIINPMHTVIEIEHPVTANKEKREWRHENIFNRINDVLERQNKPLIKWGLN
jgi:uracil DNA glycosylase